MAVCLDVLVVRWTLVELVQETEVELTPPACLGGVGVCSGATVAVIVACVLGKAPATGLQIS